jgi:5-methylcytosine-specific restriction endonuclease McrA
MTKRCARCGEDKATSEFSRHRGQPMDLASYCKPCNAEYSRTRRADPVVKATRAAAARRRREDPTIRDRDRATSSAWKALNPERARRHWDNPTKRELDRAWRASPAGRLSRRLASQRRRRWERESGGDFTAAQWAEVLEDFNHRCAYCLNPDADLQVEHIQPLSKGGIHAKENIVPACPPCNQRKGSKTLLDSLADVA